MPSLLGRDVLQHFDLSLSYHPPSVALTEASVIDKLSDEPRDSDPNVAITNAEAIVRPGQQLRSPERLDQPTPLEDTKDMRIAEEILARYERGKMKTVPFEDILAD